MENTSFKLTRILKSTPHNVFAALTEKKFISQWCKSKGIVQPKVDGNFEMFDGWVKGKVLIYEPGKELSYTWKPEDWEKEWKESIVKYNITIHGEGTVVELEHSGFPNKEETDKHKTGWDEHVFDPLSSFLSHK